MDTTSLIELLEADREMILASLNSNRSPEAAEAALEKSLDRIALRYGEQCADEGSREAAGLILKTLRSALPLMESVAEVRRWKTEAASAGKRARLKPKTIALLATGTVLELSVMLGLLFTGHRLTGILTLIEALIPAALGMAALFLAGVQHGRPEPLPEAAPAEREEFLVDPDRVWHQLKGMALLADSAVQAERVQSEQRRQAQLPEGVDGPLDGRQLELFSGLLENAYAHADPDSREAAQSIRFYLHGAGIEAVDYAEGRESWFEFLPAQCPGTMRPALIQDGKVIKKGLASA